MTEHQRTEERLLEPRVDENPPDHSANAPAWITFVLGGAILLVAGSASSPSTACPAKARAAPLRTSNTRRVLRPLWPTRMQRSATRARAKPPAPARPPRRGN